MWLFLRKGPWIAPSPLQCPNSQLLDFCTLIDDAVTGSVRNFSCSLQQREGVKVKYTCHLKTELTQFKNNTFVSVCTNVPNLRPLWQDAKKYIVDRDEFRGGIKTKTCFLELLTPTGLGWRLSYCVTVAARIFFWEGRPPSHLSNWYLGLFHRK